MNLRRGLYRAGSATGWLNAIRGGTVLLRIVRVALWRLAGRLIGRVR